MDGKGGITTASFTITVPNTLPPPPPILKNSINTQIAIPEVPFSFSFGIDTFVDIDGDELSYTVDLLPPFLSFNNLTRTFSGMPEMKDVGTYNIKLYAHDSFNESNSTSFSLSVIITSSGMSPILFQAIPAFLNIFRNSI